MGVASGMKLNALSNEKGQIKRTATNAQSRQERYFGAFFINRRSRNTAAISQLAAMPILSILRKIILSLLSVVDHAADFLRFFWGQGAVFGKSSDKGGQ